DLPEVAELDINPLLADNAGVVALDARIVARPPTAARARMAIRAYPARLEQDLVLADGLRCHMRPIRPEDAGALIEMAVRSTPEDIRLRFLGPIKEFPQAMAARLSQIDYDREMAFVAVAPPGSPAEGEIF